MNVLVLGGTLFLGRHLTRALVKHGHTVSIFTRGRTSADADLPLTRYVGDRDGDLHSLPRDGWDAVIDTSAHWPSWVAASAAHLARAKRYLYTSSISVYDARRAELGAGRGPYAAEPPDPREGDLEAYGAFKRRSEDVVRAVFGPERALVVRPGLIVGPYDPTDRFTYWVERCAEGGDILAPGTSRDIVQFIDARDLADFYVRLLEDGRSGTYDATGAQMRTTIGDVIGACSTRARRPSRVRWVAGTVLESHGLDGWIDLPLWIAPKHGLTGFMNVNVDDAVDHGLTFRSLSETVGDTAAWAESLPTGRTREAGMSPRIERELLAAIRPEA